MPVESHLLERTQRRGTRQPIQEIRPTPLGNHRILAFIFHRHMRLYIKFDMTARDLLYLI
jgi:hypothetical protein